jgi:hypothetical protein
MDGKPSARVNALTDTTVTPMAKKMEFFVLIMLSFYMSVCPQNDMIYDRILLVTSQGLPS